MNNQDLQKIHENDQRSFIFAAKRISASYYLVIGAHWIYNEYTSITGGVIFVIFSSIFL